MTNPLPVSIVIPDFSRYRGTQVYQDGASGQAYFGPWQTVDFPPAPDDGWIQIRDRDGLRLDIVSSRYYGTSDLWWVICRANDVQNPFTQLYGYATAARSPLIFAADGRPCFFLNALQLGTLYNINNKRGLTFKTTNTTLEIFAGGVSTEFFDNLSPYPLNMDGTVNWHFWGHIGSAWVNLNWVATDILQPSLSGVEAPLPQPSSSYLDGGIDPRLISLRMPSRSNIISTLDKLANP